MDRKVDDSILNAADEHLGGDDVGRASRRGSLPSLVGYVEGIIVGFTGTGGPIVAFPGNPEQTGVTATTTVPVGASDIGRRVALLFNSGDAARPLIVGRILTRDDKPAGSRQKSVDLHVDGERLVLSAEREIVLRCGDASITLTKAGKVLIRGAYVLARSSGVNRIVGGSVQIN